MVAECQSLKTFWGYEHFCKPLYIWTRRRDFNKKLWAVSLENKNSQLLTSHLPNWMPTREHPPNRLTFPLTTHEHLLWVWCGHLTSGSFLEGVCNGWHIHAGTHTDPFANASSLVWGQVFVWRKTCQKATLEAPQPRDLQTKEKEKLDCCFD